jgi:D-beta-D-heptose 7-phosphate kinase / D-beta-D-heptose 1-phosphate adenosyltransferase
MDNDLLTILEQFPNLKVLVVGEVLLDSSVRGNAGRLSLEAPVPVVDVHTSFERPGGAANVAVNAARLGASVELLSVIGQDAEGDTLLKILQAEGVETGRIIRSAKRETLLKRRIYAESQLVVRYDQGSSHAIDTESERQLLAELEERCAKMDVVVLSDYGQGVLTRTVLRGLALLQKNHPCILVADTRRLDFYRGLCLAALRPSYPSAMEMLKEHSNGTGDPLEKLSEAGERILERLNTQMVTITLDDNGALVLDRDIPVYRTYAARMPLNRIFGAGDAFISGLALSLAAGAQAPAAGEVASAVASIVVENGGQAACCIDELKAYLGGDHKLVEDWSSLETRLETLRKQGKRIVFTNGVFDILHSAHVAYLNQAKSFGDILVIGVNADESVRRLKGPSRPVNQLLERCRVLAGLSCVDFVAPFGENNPIELIHYVRPDVYVKGGDYTRETLPEAAVVEGYGGELKIVEYIANHSTTGVIERIRKLNGTKSIS